MTVKKCIIKAVMSKVFDFDFQASFFTFFFKYPLLTRTILEFRYIAANNIPHYYVITEMCCQE